MLGVVDGASVEQESAIDALDSGKTAGVEWFGVVSRWGELAFGSPGVRSMLGTLEAFVKVSFEGFFDVTRHGEVDGAGSVVPF
jgi:hypothetical protein